jgi:phage tail protein X
MSTKLQDDMYNFLQLVAKNIKEGKEYCDAIDIAAVTIGTNIPSIVSQATSKYQEATNNRTDLSQQMNIDALAFMSMDELWHEDTYDKDANISLELEDILAQSIYLVLKYSETQSPLNNALEANQGIAGAQEVRESMINIVLNA